MKTLAIKSEEIYSSMRLDGSFHLSNASIYERKIKSNKHNTLLAFVDQVFTAGRNKRVYTQRDFGYPYLSNSDVIAQNPFNNCKYNSKKHGFDKDALLEENMILTGRVGAIGQTAYVTKEFVDKKAMGSDNIIRIKTKLPELSGFIYAYLSSKIGNALMWKLATGGVQPYITENMLVNIPVPIFPEDKQEVIHSLITEAAELRVEANRLLEEAENTIMNNTNLLKLTTDDYEYFGPRSSNRKTACFVKSIKEIDSITINAFNHSERISNLITKIKDSSKTKTLYEILDDNKLFSTGSFPRVESEKGIMLINQSDIFDTIIKGKTISKRKVRTDNLVEKGEVIIAGVGTLGESETFCRVIYANEDIEGQLISGEFIRMKSQEIPSGYLYAWLNSDYGFRLIRSTQTGTKLCRPIQNLLLKIPVPILKEDIMKSIHNLVVDGHTKRHLANCKENQAIELVEKEIESWQQS